MLVFVVADSPLVAIVTSMKKRFGLREVVLLPIPPLLYVLYAAVPYLAPYPLPAPAPAPASPISEPKPNCCSSIVALQYSAYLYHT